MSAKKFDVDFEKTMKVELENPGAVEAYFISGDWKESFWTLDDLEDFVRSLSHAFECHPEHYDRERGGLSRDVEGFGTYHRAAGDSEYRLVGEAVEEIGSHISIIDEDLEAVFVTERAGGEP
ncbi:hypothetical protein PRZ61_10665 [Halomonas pacifica]|uniref:hypothetical protein n=1 Tax=Bisbaumannia pacifica TaxID=77098 RepID=UPI00235817ED|nr:hypothetical protein [Halomonas pacifica]MDC8803897.1 hypothetical protein [Halomonas pacifica]